MAVHKKTYYGPPGSFAIVDPALSYVTVLHVEREGKGQVQVSGTPEAGSLEFQYVAASGRIIFDSSNPFTVQYGVVDGPFGQYDVILNEKIFVLYKD